MSLSSEAKRLLIALTAMICVVVGAERAFVMSGLRDDIAAQKRYTALPHHYQALDFDPDIVDVFNTNTFTFTASALDREFNLGWYFVKKTIEDQAAVQIERLIGELTRFLDCNFIKVKRTGTENRFLPIKTPEDLDAARDEIAELYD